MSFLNPENVLRDIAAASPRKGMVRLFSYVRKFITDQYFATLPDLPLPVDQTPEGLKKFFEIDGGSRRIIYCPRMHRDLMDDWGMSGMEDKGAFLYLTGINYRGADSMNDELFLRGKSILQIPGFPFPIIEHSDFIPRGKLSFHIITEREIVKIGDDWVHRKSTIFDYLADQCDRPGKRISLGINENFPEPKLLGPPAASSHLPPSPR